MKDLRHLIQLLKPHGVGMACAALLSALTVGTNTGLLAVSALLISRAALHPPIGELMVLIVGVRFFGISRAVFRYLERHFAHDLTFRILKKLRVWFYERIEPLAPAYLTGYRGGDLLSRIMADVETLKDFYLRVLNPPFTALLVLSGMVFFLSRYSWMLSGVLLVSFFMTGIFLPLIIRRLGRGIKAHGGQVKAELTAVLVDSIQGLTETVTFGRAEDEKRRAYALGRELKRTQTRLGVLSGFSQGAVLFMINFTLWLILILAIPLVSEGTLDGTALAMVALTALAAFEAVLPLPLIFPYLEESRAAARRVFQIIQAKPVVHDAHDEGCPVAPKDYSLEVKNLGFYYPGSNRWVLRNLNFSLPQEGKLILAGPSGSGKSTLVNLLLRFWDYQEGSIKLGGQELKSYRRDDLRNFLGVVTQNTHLFNATVRENLLLAKPQAGMGELIRAAEKAQIHDFILSLPQGYDTYIGEGGFKLSGGQRQRLAIARLVLGDAPLWILDEATSHLDPVTEREVFMLLLPVMAEKTVLIISHRWPVLEHFMPGFSRLDLSK